MSRGERCENLTFDIIKLYSGSIPADLAADFNEVWFSMGKPEGPIDSVAFLRRLKQLLINRRAEGSTR